MTDWRFELTYWWHRQVWRFCDRFGRRFYDWHIDYGHPESQPWPGYPDDSRWGPRHEWVCDLGDWLTAGWLHD